MAEKNAASFVFERRPIAAYFNESDVVTTPSVPTTSGEALGPIGKQQRPSTPAASTIVTTTASHSLPPITQPHRNLSSGALVPTTAHTAVSFAASVAPTAVSSIYSAFGHPLPASTVQQSSWPTRSTQYTWMPPIATQHGPATSSFCPVTTAYREFWPPNQSFNGPATS